MKSLTATQTTRTEYGGLDWFRLAAAYLVIAIHISPLASFSPQGDFFFTRILARTAVPFFFMVTGQFVLSDYLNGKTGDCSAVFRYLKKILPLYGISVFLYLPIGIYAGHYKDLTVFSLLRMFFFDGTFYHLWYFPALLCGILILCILRRFCSLGSCAAISLVLYILGLLGDSYWDITLHIPGLSSVYEAGFGIFSQTRNGLFFAPLFLLMGAVILNGKNDGGIKTNGTGLALTFLAMTGEGFLLHFLDWQRHDSMYLTLPGCMFFLYRLLLCLNRKPVRFLRTASTWIYILHPAMIVAVRIMARILHQSGLLVDNSLMHYFAVSILTTLVSFVSVFLFTCKKKRLNRTEPG